MSHSYVSNLMHCTFSTKERYPFINSELGPAVRFTDCMSFPRPFPAVNCWAIVCRPLTRTQTAKVSIRALSLAALPAFFAWR